MTVADLVDELKRQPPHAVVLLGSDGSAAQYPDLSVGFGGNCVRIDHDKGSRDDDDDLHVDDETADDEAHDEIVEQCAKAIEAIEGVGQMSKTARKQCAEVIRALKVGS